MYDYGITLRPATSSSLWTGNAKSVETSSVTCKNREQKPKICMINVFGCKVDGFQGGEVSLTAFHLRDETISPDAHDNCRRQHPGRGSERVQEPKFAIACQKLKHKLKGTGLDEVKLASTSLNDMKEIFDTLGLKAAIDLTAYRTPGHRVL
jgi:hypothetical protein